MKPNVPFIGQGPNPEKYPAQRWGLYRTREDAMARSTVMYTAPTIRELEAGFTVCVASLFGMEVMQFYLAHRVTPAGGNA